MSKEKLRNVIKMYGEFITSNSGLNAEKLKLSLYDQNTKLIQAGKIICHLIWMCNEADRLIEDGRIEKAMCWLGFIQGCLWVLGARTLTEIKKDSTEK